LSPFYVEQVKGISGRQGRLRRRCRGLRSLTAVFRVSRKYTPGFEPSLHFIKLTSRVRSFICSTLKAPFRGLSVEQVMGIAFVGASDCNAFTTHVQDFSNFHRFYPNCFQIRILLIRLSWRNQKGLHIRSPTPSAPTSAFGKNPSGV